MQPTHSRLLLGACLFILLVQSSLVDAGKKRKSREEVPDPIDEEEASDSAAAREEREPSKATENGETLRGKTVDDKGVEEDADEAERKKKSYCPGSKYGEYAPSGYAHPEVAYSHHAPYGRSSEHSDDDEGRYHVGVSHGSSDGGHGMTHHKEEYGGHHQGYGGDKGHPASGYQKTQEDGDYQQAGSAALYHQAPYLGQGGSEYAAAGAYYSAPHPMALYGAYHMEHGSHAAAYPAHSVSYMHGGHGPYIPAIAYIPRHYSPPVSYGQAPSYGAPAAYGPPVSYAPAPAYGAHTVISYAPTVSYGPTLPYAPSSYHSPTYHGAGSSYHAGGYPAAHPSYHGPSPYHAPVPSYHGAPLPYSAPIPSYHGMPPSYPDASPAYHESSSSYHSGGYPSYDSYPHSAGYGGKPYYSPPYPEPSPYGKYLPYGAPHTPVYLTCSLHPSPPKMIPSYDQPHYYRTNEENPEQNSNQPPMIDDRRGNNKTEYESQKGGQGNSQSTQRPQQELAKEEIKARQVDMMEEDRNEEIPEGLSRRQRMPFSLLRQRQLESQINAKPVFFSRD